MTILKGARLISEMQTLSGDRVVVTKELILTALDRLNSKSEKKLFKMVPAVNLKVGDYRLSKYHERQPYCEDRRLSLGDDPGSWFLALPIVPNSVPVLTPIELQQILDIQMAFINLDEYPCKSDKEKKDLRKIQQRLKGLQIHEKVRAVLSFDKDEDMSDDTAVRIKETHSMVLKDVPEAEGINDEESMELELLKKAAEDAALNVDLDSDSDSFEKIEDHSFKGAGPSTSLHVTAGIRCDNCGDTGPYRCFAAVTASDFQFIDYSTAQLSMWIDKRGSKQFVSQGSHTARGPEDRQIKMCCYKCVGMMLYGNQKYFVKQSQPAASSSAQPVQFHLSGHNTVHAIGNKEGRLQLTSEWLTKSKRSKYEKTSDMKHRTARAIQSMSEKEARKRKRGSKESRGASTQASEYSDEETFIPTVEETVQILNNCSQMKKATDWVTQIGPDCYVLYGCQECWSRMYSWLCHRMSFPGGSTEKLPPRPIPPSKLCFLVIFVFGIVVFLRVDLANVIRTCSDRLSLTCLFCTAWSEWVFTLSPTNLGSK